MSLRALGLSVVAAFFVTGNAFACAMHGEVAVNKTPVDYSKLTKMELADVPVDAWLIKYLDEWRKA